MTQPPNDGPTTPPSSEPQYPASAGQTAYSHQPAGYGPPTGPPEPVTAAAETAAVRRWRIITAVACLAAALVIVSFFLVGQSRSSDSQAPVTETVVDTATVISTTTGSAATRTATDTVTETATETATSNATATRTVTDTVTRTRTEIDTKTVTETVTPPAKSG